MAGFRFEISLFIPEAAYNALPSATRTAIRDRIRQLKALAVVVNAGAANEEMTVKATRHICYHDEATPKPCEPEQDI